MADTKISQLSLDASPLPSDVFPIYSNNTTSQVSLSGALNAVGLVNTTANYVIVPVTNSATTNGTNLLNAYATACTLTPGGSALSTTNRTVVLIPPGTYTTSTGLQLNTQYVDIVGISSDANHAIIDKVNQTANDVQVSNITVARNGCSLASNLSLTVWTNCIVSNNNDNSGSFGNNILSGTFTNCTGSNNGGNSGGGFAGPSATLSGTFTNCVGTNSGASGAFGGGFGGQNSTLSGTFTNCTGSNNNSPSGAGFGGSGATLSGTFTNCKGSNISGPYGGGFAGTSATLSGTFTNCVGTNSGFFGGGFSNTGTVSGTFINCIGSNNGPGEGSSFAGSGAILSGTFTNCTSRTDTGFRNGPRTAKIRNYVDANGDVYNYN